MTVELMGTAERALHPQEFAALYAQAQRFYADQMHIMDAHDTERWAATFTDDGVLELPHLAGALPARAALARHARAGERLAHWVGILDVRAQADGSLHTRCSALVLTGGLLYVCAMEDVLVRDRGEWRIAYRRVTRDDLA